MRKLLTPIFLTLLFIQNYAQKSNANIINYFASNNQIIGVPMVDMKNQFRFYPDLSFQEAITGVEVYYFVLNDVYKHHLVQREGGRYWEATLRSFSLGESIQRVEVIVGCSIPQLNSLLVSYGFDHASTKTLNHYLLLRRGDDKGLIKQSTFERLTNALNDKHNAYKANVEALISLLKQSNTLTYILKDQNKSILTKLATAIQTLEVIKTKGTITPKDKANIESAINDVNTDLSATKDSILLNLQSEIQFQNIEITSAFNDYQSVVDKIAPLDLNINNGQFNYDLLKEIAPEPSNKLYAAYVENRLASMLDMKLKENDPTIIQFNYRNDKQSLQYLQADDPQEKLGIFRARLVPFPFYKPPAVVPFEQQDFTWQRGK